MFCYVGAGHKQKIIFCYGMTSKDKLLGNIPEAIEIDFAICRRQCYCLIYKVNKVASKLLNKVGSNYKVSTCLL